MLLAAVSLGVAVPVGRSQNIVELHVLPAPGPLSEFAARRAASTLLTNLLELSESHSLAVGTADHMAALARHQAVLDRPHHEPVQVVLGPEETLTQVRRHWRLRQHDLARLNPGLDLNRVRPGDTVTVWVYDPEHPARSNRRPNRGRLLHGELMPPGEGWVVADETRAFGATQTIDALVHAARVTLTEYPGGQDILVADISELDGGRLRPHRSHQSGRDVDVTYYRRTTDPPTFTRTRPSELDEKRTWHFLRTLITQHDVTYVFASRRLMVRLYEYAESIGEHPAWLARLFQYGPRGHRNHRAMIRYLPGHHDHLHIRFDCTPEDVRCRDAG